MSMCDYRFGRWLVEPERNRITAGKIERHLEPLGIEILCHLLERAGHTVSAEELLATIWCGRVVEGNAVPRAINLIRRALDDDPQAPQYIETIRKRGYRTIAPVRVVDPDTPESSRWRLLIPIGLLPLVGGVALWWLMALPEPTGPGSESRNPANTEARLIVLPFANLGGDPGDDYLADGLAEELISTLGRIDALSVVPRTSSFYFKDREYDLANLADSLNVSHAIEGSVRRAGDEIRITARLLETRRGSEVASLTLDRDLDNVLQLQREVAIRMVDGLAVRLSKAEFESATDAGTDDEAAYDLFLRAEALARADNLEDWRKAKQLYRSAIERDPDFHRAYHGLAGAIAMEGFRGNRRPQVVQEYLAVRDHLAGIVDNPWRNRTDWARHWLDGDWPEAEAIVARALREDPGDVFWLDQYGLLLANAGLIEASLGYWRLLNRIDPFNPEWFERIGNMMSAMDRHEAAVAAYDRCLALAPQRSGCTGEKEMALSLMGEYEAAEAIRPGHWGLPLCLSPHHRSECRTLVESGGYDLPRHATLKGYVAMLGGDLDTAFEYLEEAADQPFSFVYQVRWQNYGATSAFLRDPRYEALLGRLGLTDAWRETLCRRAQALTAATGVPVTCNDE